MVLIDAELLPVLRKQFGRHCDVEGTRTDVFAPGWLEFGEADRTADRRAPGTLSPVSRSRIPWCVTS